MAEEAGAQTVTSAGTRAPPADPTVRTASSRSGSTPLPTPYPHTLTTASGCILASELCTLQNPITEGSGAALALRRGRAPPLQRAAGLTERRGAGVRTATGARLPLLDDFVPRAVGASFGALRVPRRLDGGGGDAPAARQDGLRDTQISRGCRASIRATTSSWRKSRERA